MKIVSFFSYSTWVIEVLALITSVLYYSKISKDWRKAIPYYLGFIVVAKTISMLTNSQAVTVFDYSICIEFCFYFSLFHQFITSRKTKQTVWLFMIAYLLFCIADTIWIQNSSLPFKSYSFVFGNVLVIITAIIFLRQLFNSQELIDFKHNLLFWIAMGVIFFYIAELPVIGAIQFVQQKTSQINSALFCVKFMLSNLLYSTFIIGFLCLKKTK